MSVCGAFEEVPLSHVVTIQTQLHDAVAINAACRRLNLPVPVQGTAELFSGKATGLLVQLPGWLYPTVIDTLTGAVRYDDFGGRWGDQIHLSRFLQLYAVERAKIEAREKGYAVTEQARQELIKLQIIEGGV